MKVTPDRPAGGTNGGLNMSAAPWLAQVRWSDTGPVRIIPPDLILWYMHQVDDQFRALKARVDQVLGREGFPRIEVLDDRSAEYLRRMTGQQRFRIAAEMFSMTRAMLMHHLRREHPGWSQDELAAETSRRISHGAA